MSATLTVAQPGGGGLTVGGIPVPFHGPVLLGLVALHVMVGLGAVVTGAVAMLSPKRAGRHPRLGTAYFWLLAVVCATMVVLAVDRWPADVALLTLGCLALCSGVVGRWARQRRFPSWVRWHVGGMGMSYVIMLTAFYVDNGPHLPLWDRLPAVVYWTLPSLIGIPLIARGAVKYRNL